ncbi:AbrB/MazE/SpoVT family DNA-binding domain-containing protein [Candidatus Amesbacteria bacterium]|nr:AbrB/MazE/SpoVT family DNA-binding domain-containing protein [Candidatus Amesbacteria bacterium]
MNLQLPVTGTSTLSSRNQLSLPSAVRKAWKAKSGDKYIWSYNPVTNETILKPSPKSWGSYLYGLGTDKWDRTDAQKYVDGLRKDRQIPGLDND